MQKKAYELIAAHNLEGWRFEFDRAKTRCGCTNYGSKVISISKYYIDDPLVDDADIMNTVLHEIAHVIAGYEAGHNQRWRMIAQSIGCDGQVCNNGWSGAPYKYRITCHCGMVHARRHVIQTRLRRKRCVSCDTLHISSLK